MTQMGIWEGSIKQHMKETRDVLSEHSGHMGLATKAINGDMLKIKENIFDLKKEIISEIESVKNFSSNLQRDSLTVSHNLNIAVESFEDKFGRIIEIKKNQEMHSGKILKIEESTGELRVQLAKSHDQISQIAKALNNQRSDIEKLKVKKGDV